MGRRGYKSSPSSKKRERNHSEGKKRHRKPRTSYERLYFKDETVQKRGTEETCSAIDQERGPRPTERRGSVVDFEDRGQSPYRRRHRDGGEKSGRKEALTLDSDREGEGKKSRR